MKKNEQVFLLSHFEMMMMVELQCLHISHHISNINRVMRSLKLLKARDFLAAAIYIFCTIFFFTSW
jgi:hypothetical protein